MHSRIGALKFPSLDAMAESLGDKKWRNQICRWKRLGLVSYEGQRGVRGICIAVEEYDRLRSGFAAYGELRRLGFWHGPDGD